MVGQPPRGLQPVAARARRLGQGRAQRRHPGRVRRQRHQVGLREVPVVRRGLLAAPRPGVPGVLVEVPGLLHDAPALVQERGLAQDLRPYRPLHAAQRVDVLGLGAGTPRLAGPVQRGVHVAAQRALLHPHVGDAQAADDLAQLGDVRAGDVRREGTGTGYRPGHDLHQRDAGPVVVDQRLGRAVDPAGGTAEVQRLAGVLLQVYPLDAHPDGLPVDQHVQPAVHA